MAWKADDIHKALTVLSVYAGNASLAARALKEEQGMNVRPDSLRKWRVDYSDMYDEIRAAMPDATKQVISEAMETARLAAMAERLAIERTHHQLETGECKDPAKAARDLSAIKATNVEKFLTLTGRPTEIVQHTTPAELFKGLMLDGIFKAVEPGHDADGTVIEIPDGLVQLPPGAPKASE